MFDQLKKLKRVVFRQDFYMNPTIRVKCKKFGSEYGGWYVATDYLNKTDLIILSFGLGEDISFDQAMITNFNCKIYGFDPTPKAISYTKSLNLDSDHFQLKEYALSDTNGTLSFNLPENSNHVSGSLENINSRSKVEVECKDIKTIQNELYIDHIDILKMDIEGSEYKVINNMIENKIFPDQVLIEYHHFFKNISKSDTKNSIKLLLENGYELFYIDSYNYSFIKTR